MTAYAIAHLQESPPHRDVVEYIERIPGTFEPFGGQFLVHVTQHEVKEGSWPGHVVLIGFPDIDRARAWWDSPEYRQIAPLRSRHIPGDIILVDGVPEGYDPRATAQSMRDALPVE
ncbi:DUF1330 domain-containing protein [Pseudactinotalea suaedae]|uniref:DUF1330 domain-containing protein n=1 Tax=Pseudactinotalea suaedae TaxID=1524924 RepID=UPI0012E185FA|nr:DUF1330 domain-containing protein [Pseudactinotalea suaedae]